MNYGVHDGSTLYDSRLRVITGYVHRVGLLVRVDLAFCFSRTSRSWLHLRIGSRNGSSGGWSAWLALSWLGLLLGGGALDDCGPKVVF